MELTSEQEEFSKTRNKHILALASAGAGKTHTLIHFIQDKLKDGVKANEIISFSFTRKAANELKERVELFFKGLDLDFRYISTIHSFCWNELIKPFYKEIGYTSLPTIIHEIPEEFLESEFKNYAKKQERNSYFNTVKNLINKDLQSEDFKESETIRLLQYLVENNLVMFDFMIHLANYILSEEPHKVKNTIKKIKYVITDEAQDLNPAQYRFTKLLQSIFSTENYETRLVKVGDFKQSIYKFRGSDPTIITTFVDEFSPEIKIMSYNFRSAPEIVDLANSIAETIDLGNDELNKSKFQVAAQTDLEGEVYNIYDVEDFLDELRHFEQPLDEICILARTNFVIKSLAKILGALNIPYYLHTEYDILKRAEVKFLMNMLSIVTHGYNKPLAIAVIKAAKGIIPIKIDRGIDKCNSMSDINKMFGDIKKIPEIYKIYALLSKGLFNDAIPLIGNLLQGPKKPKDLIETSLHRFYKDLKTVKDENHFSTWMEALEELLFEAQFLEQKTKGKIQLMTVHKAKGLQWRTVMFIYDFSILERFEDSFYDVEEEKRVVYTAITRPKEHLIIWDLDKNAISELFMKNKLLKQIENGLTKGYLDIDDFQKWE